jgi:general secretion pathway protein G
MPDASDNVETAIKSLAGSTDRVFEAGLWMGSAEGSRTAQVMRSGLSVVELVIVVCIIGILAALVVPLVQNQATDAKTAAATDNLRILRSTIELYAANHAGVPPGYNGNNRNGALDEDFFRDQTVVQEDYMQRIPENPFNNLRTILMVGNNQPFPSDATGDYGWVYQPSTQTIRLDWPGTDNRGVRHFDF